jgi:hypothetical protein
VIPFPPLHKCLQQSADEVPIARLFVTALELYRLSARLTTQEAYAKIVHCSAEATNDPPK